MKRQTQGKRKLSAANPDGRYQLVVDPRLDQRAEMEAMRRAGDDLSEQWFRMKFLDDLSDIQPEKRSYYKHLVHHFVAEFFTEEKVRGKRILDLGCGAGFYSAILCQRGAEVTGIDLSPFLIRKANEHKTRLGLTALNFIQADFGSYSLRMRRNEFDYVLAIDTLVSFDYCRAEHNHQKATQVFAGISRVLKDDGKCFVIESHPFFGPVGQELLANTGEYFCVRSPHYKIEYKLKSDVHHWFTLEEMTKATSENGLAISRIYEPDPAMDLKKENAAAYAFRLKYPGMIVYDIRKMGRLGNGNFPKTGH